MNKVYKDVEDVLENTYFHVQNIYDFLEILLDVCYIENAETLEYKELRKKYIIAQKLTNCLYELVRDEIYQLKTLLGIEENEKCN